MQGVLGAVIIRLGTGSDHCAGFLAYRKFFPPLVNGCVITVIGMSLMPVAAHWAMGGNAKSADYGSMGNIGLAGLSLFMVLLFNGWAMPCCRACRFWWRSWWAPSRPVCFIPAGRFLPGVQRPHFCGCPPFAFRLAHFRLWLPPSPCSSLILVILVETSADDAAAVGEIVDSPWTVAVWVMVCAPTCSPVSWRPSSGGFTQSAFARTWVWWP